MGIKDALGNLKDTVKHELNAAKGEEAKHKLFDAEHTYSSEPEAKDCLEVARQKLFDVNRWSELKGINSTFTLFDENGHVATEKQVKVGQYIRIELPGTKTENWVVVTAVQNQPDTAEFTVRPSEKPAPASDESKKEVKHFFTEEASSTFRVERDKNVLRAYEIGLNEKINNEGEKAGARAALNTLIAEGGWAFFQKLQWDKLTNYLVHNLEP